MAPYGAEIEGERPETLSRPPVPAYASSDDGEDGRVKYDPLLRWLARRETVAVELPFREIEGILGAPLPRSAKIHPAFWAAGNHLGRLLAGIGWRAGLRGRSVRFEPTRAAMPKPPRAKGDDRRAPKHGWTQVVLLGCTKSKRREPAPARDLYDPSPLFRGRRAHAEALGVPWFVISAKYGLLEPDRTVEPYDVTIADLTPAERRLWAERVVAELASRLGSLAGRRIEIHAGEEYRETGLVRLLRERGAEVAVPLAGLGLGEQLAWYGRGDAPSGRVAVVRTAPVRIAHPADVRTLVELLTVDFATGRLEREHRPGMPAPGWAAMPEAAAAERLRTAGFGEPQVRVFLTLAAALDRARDADRLWSKAADLVLRETWIADPEIVSSLSSERLAGLLARAGVSQRHGPDCEAWQRIATALVDPRAPAAVRHAVFEGEGEAEELRAALDAKDPSGEPWFPLLRGPKISVMWVRMLTWPGGARIRGLETLPVAVDVQVRRVSERLGVAATAGLDIAEARSPIQRAWRQGIEMARGPERLQRTAAALDPALWFWGKWGCGLCEREGRRVPFGRACVACRFGGEAAPGPG